MDTMRTLPREGAGRVWVRTFVAAIGGGALLGAVVASGLSLVMLTTALVWVKSMLLGAMIGGAIGAPLGLVVGGVLAGCQARSRQGLSRTAARAAAGLGAGVPLALTFGVMSLDAPRVLVGVVLPISLAAAAFAAAVAPPLVSPPRRRTVNARRIDAGAAAGTASPGWSRAPGR